MLGPPAGDAALGAVDEAKAEVQAMLDGVGGRAPRIRGHNTVTMIALAVGEWSAHHSRDATFGQQRDVMHIWYKSVVGAGALFVAASLGACSSGPKSDIPGGQVEAIPPSSIPAENGPNVGAPATSLMSGGANAAQTALAKAAATRATAGQGVMPANPGQGFLAGDAERLQGELAQIKARAANRDASLQQIKNGLALDASAFNAATAAVKTGLQSGRQPGDSALLGQWSEAQAALARVDSNMAKLVALSVQSSQDASFADYIADSAKRAHALQGSAVDRDRLTTIQADAVATGGAARAQKTVVDAEIERQTAGVTRGRAGLMQLASAIERGTLYPAGKGAEAAAQRAATIPAPPPGNLHGRKPLVVIHFDQPNVRYDEPVRKAAALALQRKPSTIFDVVASAPAEGAPGAVESAREKSKAHAEAVIRSLMGAGVPSNQLALTLAAPQSAGGSEVLIFVR
jgi:hypothetical protein